MGVVECLNHRLVEPFNVLYEKDGECIIDEPVPVPCQLLTCVCMCCASSFRRVYCAVQVHSVVNAQWTTQVRR